jgi:hypothetical protein
MAPGTAALRQLVHARNRAGENFLQALDREARLAKSCLFKRLRKGE